MINSQFIMQSTFSDSSVIDPKLLEVFDRVRQSADFMPASQMKVIHILG